MTFSKPVAFLSSLHIVAGRAPIGGQGHVGLTPRLRAQPHVQVNACEMAFEGVRIWSSFHFLASESFLEKS